MQHVQRPRPKITVDVPPPYEPVVGMVYMMRSTYASKEDPFDPYILARISEDYYSFICLKTGNRFSDPMTEDELKLPPDSYPVTKITIETRLSEVV